MTKDLRLISHPLCPYVQRAAIVLAEKDVPFERIDIDLARKPDWFLRLSPLGKTPVLVVDDRALFESAVIVEFLDETQPPALHPADALARAEHRAWIAFASAVLDDIAGLYSAADGASFDARRERLAGRLATLEQRLVADPWFDGAAFSLVDAAAAPVFRYLEAFERVGACELAHGLPRIARWRSALAARPSVRDAVRADYPERLMAFLARRGSHLSSLILARNAA